MAYARSTLMDAEVRTRSQATIRNERTATFALFNARFCSVSAASATGSAERMIATSSTKVFTFSALRSRSKLATAECAASSVCPVSVTRCDSFALPNTKVQPASGTVGVLPSRN